MRSNDWDKEKDAKHDRGFKKHDNKDHEHHFDPITHKCAICLKSREDLRKEW